MDHLDRWQFFAGDLDYSTDRRPSDPARTQTVRAGISIRTPALTSRGQPTGRAYDGTVGERREQNQSAVHEEHIPDMIEERIELDGKMVQEGGNLSGSKPKR